MVNNWIHSAPRHQICIICTIVSRLLVILSTSDHFPSFDCSFSSAKHCFDNFLVSAAASFLAPLSFCSCVLNAYYFIIIRLGSLIFYMYACYSTRCKYRASPAKMLWLPSPVFYVLEQVGSLEES